MRSFAAILIAIPLLAQHSDDQEKKSPNPVHVTLSRSRQAASCSPTLVRVATVRGEKADAVLI